MFFKSEVHVTSSWPDLDTISQKVPKTNLKFNLSLSDSVRLRFELKICPWRPFWGAQVPSIIVGRTPLACDLQGLPGPSLDPH